MDMKKFTLMLLMMFFSTANAGIEPTSGRFVEIVEDLTVKVAGGQIVWERTYEEGQWKFNLPWAPLVREIDSATGAVIRITRGGDSYEKLDSAGTIFKFGPRMQIRKNPGVDAGWTWTDRDGNHMLYDDNGRTLSMGHMGGFSASFTYTGDDMTGIMVNGTEVLTIAYTTEGQVDKVTDHGPNGHTPREVDYHWLVIPNSNPVRYKLTGVTDARENNWAYDYSTQVNQDGYVNLTKITDPENRETLIEYGASGRVKKITNALNQSTHYTFDYIKARKEYYLKTTYPGGRVVESWFERDGELKRKDINGMTLTTVTEDLRKDLVKDAFGRVTIKEYDEFRNLLKTTYPDGSSTSATYDVTNSNVLTRTDERGTVTRYEYHANGLLHRMTEALGTDVERATEYTYHPSGDLHTLTQVGDAVTEEAVTTYEYDGFGNLTKLINAEGHETEYQNHDAMGNAWSMIDGRDKVWTYTYDAHGNLTSSTTPLQHTTSQEFDKVGNMIKVIHPDTQFETYEFDEINRIIKTINELGHGSSIEYDLAGNVVSETDQMNRTTTYEYDLFNRLVVRTDANNEVTELFYPIIGEDVDGLFSGPKQIKYPTVTMDLKYDLLGQITEEKEIYTSGSLLKTELTQFKFDFVGNLTEEIRKDQNTIKYVYDELNQLVSSTEANEIITSYTYDNRGNLLTVTNGLQQSHHYSYDKINQTKTYTRPMGETEVNTYDENGNLITFADAKNQLVKYHVDDSNRITLVEYHKSDGLLDHTVDFQYNSRNSLVGFSDSNISGVMIYDYAQQKLNESVTYDGHTFEHSYTYFPDGSKATYKGNDQIEYAYQYNNIGKLQSLTIPNVGIITYKDFKWSRPQTIQYPGGVIRRNQYDGLQRLVNYEVKNSNDQIISGADYSYSAIGNVETKSFGHLDYVYNYNYDDFNRLISADYPNIQDESFTYDALGNRKTDSATGFSEWIYNHNNQLLDAVQKKYEYDENGNQIIEKDAADQLVRQNVYNSQNRLSEVKDASGQTVVTYQYDPFGRRLSKTVTQPDQSTIKTYFFYSDEGYSAEMTNGVVISYLYHPNATWSTDPILKLQNGNYYFYQNDHLTAPQTIHDLNGVVVNDREYKVFGDWVNLNSTIDDSFGFPGHYKDSEKTTMHNYHREYSMENGSYSQPDPLGLYAGINEYIYANNNPMGMIDPDGLRVTRPIYYPPGTLRPVLTPVRPRPQPDPGPNPGPVPPGPVPAPNPDPDPFTPIPDLPLPPELEDVSKIFECKKCRDCNPPKGTLCYFKDNVPGSSRHYPFEGDHFHIFRMNQDKKTCKCQWNPLKKDKNKQNPTHKGAKERVPIGSIPCPFPRLGGR